MPVPAPTRTNEKEWPGPLWAARVAAAIAGGVPGISLEGSDEEVRALIEGLVDDLRAGTSLEEDLLAEAERRSRAMRGDAPEIPIGPP